MTRRIGGIHGHELLAALAGRPGDSDYHARATSHRPADPDVIAREVRRLHASGLTAHDVAAALRLTIPEVLDHLGPGG